MDVDRSQALVVLVGAFNTQILREPDWIKRYLFPDSSQDSLELKMNLEMPAEKITSIVEVDGIQIEVKQGRLAITPKDISQEYIEKIYHVIKNISANLPHTPMVAYGINFGFTGECKKPFLWKRTSFNRFLMDFEKTDAVLELKQVLGYDGYKINFTISEKKIATTKFEERLSFNFHTPVSANVGSALEDLLRNKKIEYYQSIAKKHAEWVINDGMGGIK